MQINERILRIWPERCMNILNYFTTLNFIRAHETARNQTERTKAKKSEKKSTATRKQFAYA